ncbi:phage tail length tape measure family protein [Luteimonas cellulosilyticus]|uniref:phage tail length tape measure family protein n=1 Tax=Luteimonas cellulosilyticus TaxID=2683586 RepID=UPI001359D504|nr:phage tail length tape measure family protein [Luteimonas cellulosilyticus]
MATRGNATMEEAIRLVLETQGREGVDALRDALSQVGDVSVETQQETAGLIDNLVELNETAAKAARYGELTAELERSQIALDQASQSAYQLTLELGNAEKPSRELVRAQKAARDEVDRLEGAVTKQWQALERADTELGSLGVNTADYARAQEDLRNNIGRTTAAVADQVAVVQKQSTAQRQLRERLEEGDDKFRRFAQSGTAAAESLDAYRARAAAAKDETANVAREADGASGVFGRLRGVVAGVFGFFSARSLIGGLRSIITEGSNAEQELGQLNAVLESTGRQSEFAAGELQTMADNLARASQFAAGDIINAQTRLLSYTNILRGEFPDAMQIVIDQSARLGISLEQSAEIVGRSLQEPTKAMQALGRQGFVLEESQKTLLAQLEATGKTADAQRIIMDLLVESYGGAAAAAKVGTMAGLWKTISENFKDFQQDIADRGVLDYFKAQLTDLLNTTARLQRDGTLGRWAQQIADGIVRVASASRDAVVQLLPLVKVVGDAATVFARNAEAVFLLAKAYVGLKLVQLVTQYAALTNAKIANLAATRALTAATAAQGAATLSLGDRLRSLPSQLRIGVALLGVDWALQQVVQLKATIDDMADAEAQTEAWGRAQRSLQQENLRLGRQLQALYQANADVAIQSAEQINALGMEEAQGYRYRLQEAAKYYEGVIREARATGDAMRAAAAQDQWRQVLLTLEQVQARISNNGISAGARAIANELAGIDRSAKTAREELGKLFDNLDFNDGQALRDTAVAISDIGARSATAARNVTEGLEAALARLSGEELLKLQANAQTAFAEFETAPRGAAVVLDTVLLTAMKRLGVASAQWGVDITSSGRDAIASFTTVAQAANATSAQIEAAFKSALGLAATEAEAKALGDVMKTAGEQGKLGFDGTERSLVALRARIGEIQGALNPLNDSFRRLGITSKAELDRAAAAAKDAFHEIRQAAATGEAAIEDVRAAAQRYGEAMRAAAANSDAATQKRVENEIRLMEEIFRVNDGLDTMAERGTRAATRSPVAPRRPPARCKSPAARQTKRPAVWKASPAPPRMSQVATRRRERARSAHRWVSAPCPRKPASCCRR